MAPIKPNTVTELMRIPVEDVRCGDRMGDGRWQGVQIVSIRSFPTLNGTYHLLLGAHGEISLFPHELVLIERALDPS